MVVRFLFGITAKIIGSKETTNRLLTSIKSSCTPWIICHCLFEAGHTNLSLVEKVCVVLFDYHYQATYSCTAHDFTALIHVITHTHRHRLVSVNFIHSGITRTQISAFVRAITAKEGKHSFFFLLKLSLRISHFHM